MATPSKTSKKTPAKKASATKTTSAPTLASLEKRIAHLEDNNLVSKAEGLYGTTRNKVKESYADNPGLTIVIGLGILVVLLLIIT